VGGAREVRKEREEEGGVGKGRAGRRDCWVRGQSEGRDRWWSGKEGRRGCLRARGGEGGGDNSKKRKGGAD